LREREQEVKWFGPEKTVKNPHRLRGAELSRVHPTSPEPSEGKSDAEETTSCIATSKAAETSHAAIDTKIKIETHKKIDERRPSRQERTSFKPETREDHQTASPGVSGRNSSRQTETVYTTVQKFGIT